MKLARPLCWLGWHDWKFTLNFVQPARMDSAYDMHDISHYSGECSRCGKRDLFRGPAPPVIAEKRGEP